MRKVIYSTWNLPATWEDFFCKDKSFPNITIYGKSKNEEGKTSPYISCAKEFNPEENWIDIFTSADFITHENAADFIECAMEEFFDEEVEVSILVNPATQTI